MIILMIQNRHCDRIGHSFERIVVWQKMPLLATVNELAQCVNAVKPKPLLVTTSNVMLRQADSWT